MSVRVTHVRLSGGTEHLHITHLRWQGIETAAVDTSSRSDLADWIEQGGRAYVGIGAAAVPVGVVKPVSGVRYLRTYADGRWTNNLLSLPHF